MSEPVKKTLNDWRDAVHANAAAHGWWVKVNDTVPSKLLLVHSEISEAAEELRKARPCPHGAADADYDDLRKIERWEGKPEGFAVELADALIRILDICGRLGIDIESVVQMKHEFNVSRPVRHGGKLV